MRPPYAVTVTVLPRHIDTGRDVYGDPTGTEPVGHKVRGCIVAPRAGIAVDQRGRDGNVRLCTIIAPADADITDHDRLLIHDPGWAGEWTVDGPVQQWNSPFVARPKTLTVDLRQAVG